MSRYEVERAILLTRHDWAVATYDQRRQERLLALAEGLTLTPELGRYVFEVDFATDKDTLKTGEVVAGTHVVAVLAENDEDARLVAEQMVACFHEPTGVRLVDFPN